MWTSFQTLLPSFGLVLAVLCTSGLVRALLLGLFIGQMAGLAHDCTHAVTSARWWVTCLGWGVSHTWFRKDHLAHHRLCNTPLEDPHFDYTPLFVQSTQERCTPHFWSQQLFFPIVILFGRLNIHVTSIVHAVRHGLLMECLGVVANIVWTTSALEKWVHVLAMHATVGAVVHVPFLLNHYTHDQYDAEQLQKMTWIERQLRTTINYSASPWWSWMLCGLDLHMEHHAFPQVPRHELHTLTPKIKAACKKYGIKYEPRTVSSLAVDCYVKMTSIVDGRT